MNKREEQIKQAIKDNPGCCATQGGGLVVWDELQLGFVFVLTPDWGEFQIGDSMPNDWGTGPVALTS